MKNGPRNQILPTPLKQSTFLMGYNAAELKVNTGKQVAHKKHLQENQSSLV